MKLSQVLRAIFVANLGKEHRQQLFQNAESKFDLAFNQVVKEDEIMSSSLVEPEETKNSGRTIEDFVMEVLKTQM